MLSNKGDIYITPSKDGNIVEEGLTDSKSWQMRMSIRNPSSGCDLTITITKIQLTVQSTRSQLDIGSYGDEGG